MNLNIMSAPISTRVATLHDFLCLIGQIFMLDAHYNPTPMEFVSPPEPVFMFGSFLSISDSITSELLLYLVTLCCVVFS